MSERCVGYAEAARRYENMTPPEGETRDETVKGLIEELRELTTREELENVFIEIVSDLVTTADEFKKILREYIELRK